MSARSLHACSLQFTDVVDDRLAPTVDVDPLPVANAVSVAGHIDHVALSKRRNNPVVRLLIADHDTNRAQLFLIDLQSRKLYSSPLSEL
jgi:hypothetical protein